MPYGQNPFDLQGGGGYRPPMQSMPMPQVQANPPVGSQSGPPPVPTDIRLGNMNPRQPGGWTGGAIDPRTGQPWAHNVGPSDRAAIMAQQNQPAPAQPSVNGMPAMVPPGGPGMGLVGGAPVGQLDPRTGGPVGFPGMQGPPMYQGAPPPRGGPESFGRPNEAPPVSPGYNPNQDASKPGGAGAPAPSVSGMPAQVPANPFPRPGRPRVSPADQAAAVAADRAMFQPGGSQYHGPAATSAAAPPQTPVVTQFPAVANTPPRGGQDGPPGQTNNTDRNPAPSPQQPPIRPPASSLNGGPVAGGAPSSDMSAIARRQTEKMRPKKPRPSSGPASA